MIKRTDSIEIEFFHSALKWKVSITKVEDLDEDKIDHKLSLKSFNGDKEETSYSIFLFENYYNIIKNPELYVTGIIDSLRLGVVRA